MSGTTSDYYENFIAAHHATRAFYRFHESAGTTLREYTEGWMSPEAGGTGHVGAPSGTYAGSGITYGVTGPIEGGKAVTFDGTSDPATVPDDDALDLGDVLSIEFWFKRSATQGVAQTLLPKGNNAYQVVFTAANALRFQKQNVAGAIVETPAITDQSWHHAVFTKNGATSKAYLDGSDVSDPGTNQTLTDTTNALRIGHLSAGNQRFPGSLAELALYSVALNPDELYENRGRDKPAPPARNMHVLAKTVGTSARREPGERKGAATGSAEASSGGYARTVSASDSFRLRTSQMHFARCGWCRTCPQRPTRRSVCALPYRRGRGSFPPQAVLGGLVHRISEGFAK